MRSIILSLGPMRKTVIGPVVSTLSRIITPVAWMMATPPLRPVSSPWRSQSWPPLRASGPPPASRKFCSSKSALAKSMAEIGLTIDNRQDTDGESADDGPEQELPGGEAGGAGDDEFGGAG